MAGGDFLEWLKAAEIHWFFAQAEQALEADLYLPGCIGFINGIEASIRFTVHQLDGKDLDDDLGATLSNPLLRMVRDRGLPVHTLAFPGEVDFGPKLQAKQPYVEIVRLRYNLAHGNIVEFVNREYGLFTPECLRDVSQTLLTVSRQWARELGAFRNERITAKS